MAYAVENALFQWQEGERWIGEADTHPSVDLDAAAEAVVEELRRRLGGTFVIGELADLYAGGTDWAAEVAGSLGAGSDSAHVVDAAFNRYAREASDFGGGRPRETHARP